ncbi:hypothetical protein PR048_018692 [Dryococelus australis]|uniref:DDE Tnp4 domain-containing protein n=1 Tax=Dryococelus australis TaxID=614101 RepID=A0ABQ9HD67_9NEOP|nr:hypothetical protein PR048_018692 [Dryococelus australis]
MSAMGDDDMLAAAAVVLILKKNTKKRTRKWCKEWLMKRNSLSHTNLLNELRITYCRFLSLVAPLIEKEYKVMRKSIATLNHAPMQQKMIDLVEIVAQVYHSIPVNHPTFHEYSLQCRPENSLLQFPQTEDEWKKTAHEFESRWNFPHLSDVSTVNILKSHLQLELVLFYINTNTNTVWSHWQIADANYHFILTDFGINGRISDSGVLCNTVFHEKLTNGSLYILSACQVINRARKLPHVFVGDNAFPLRCDIDLDSVDKSIYYYRLSRTRRVVENVFGLLAGRFRVFHTAINHIDSIMIACCALHSYLMTQHVISTLHQKHSMSKMLNLAQLSLAQQPRSRIFCFCRNPE